jgi:hypothetical protein
MMWNDNRKPNRCMVPSAFYRLVSLTRFARPLQRGHPVRSYRRCRQKPDLLPLPEGCVGRRVMDRVLRDLYMPMAVSIEKTRWVVEIVTNLGLAFRLHDMMLWLNEATAGHDHWMDLDSSSTRCLDAFAAARVFGRSPCGMRPVPLLTL